MYFFLHKQFCFPRVFGQLRDSKNPEHKQKTKKIDLPKILLTGLFFVFLVFLVFRVLGQFGSGQQKPREKKSGLDLPKIFSQEWLFVFLFFGFPRVFEQLGLGQQKPREKPKNKRQKNTNLNGLTQGSSHKFFLFCFPRVFGQLSLGRQKHREKQKTKDPKKREKKTNLNGLTLDSSHRFFLVFPGFLDSCPKSPIFLMNGGKKMRINNDNSVIRIFRYYY